MKKLAITLITLMLFTTLLFGQDDGFHIDEGDSYYRVSHIQTTDLYLGFGEGFMAGVRISYDHLLSERMGWRLLYARNYQEGAVAGSGQKHQFGAGDRLHFGILRSSLSEGSGAILGLTGGVNHFRPTTEIGGVHYSYGDTLYLEAACEGRLFLRMIPEFALYFHLEGGVSRLIYHANDLDLRENDQIDRVNIRFQFGLGIAILF